MKSCGKIILWAGPKHSGKTTAAFELAGKAKKEGFKVTGILAPAIYEGGKLSGFDLLDIQSGKRIPFARRKESNPFSFTTKGFRFDEKILSAKSTAAAELIIIDEFGPLELSGKGWRKCVDKLISSSPALLLLVVRKELIKKVEQLYKNLPIQKINALDKNSVKKVLTMLKNNKMVLNKLKKHSKDRKISCTSCFKVADKLRAPLKMVGRLCNENKIKITSCQLGCFK